MFLELEKLLKEKIPKDIVKILDACSFDTDLSFWAITAETIDDIEEFVNDDLSVLENTSYEGVNKFKLKPGHKSFILNLPIRLTYLKEKQIDEPCKISEFSQILRTFIETAEANFGNHPNGFRYDQINRHFSTFIYLMCGRACYDALSANLPIPQASTIGEILFSFIGFLDYRIIKNMIHISM